MIGTNFVPRFYSLAERSLDPPTKPYNPDDAPYDPIKKIDSRSGKVCSQQKAQRLL